MVAMNVWPTDAADGSVASEARWRKMGRHWAASGVALGVGGQMNPTLVYPNLTVKAGACWVDGHFCELAGDQVLAVTPNGLAVVRFDPAANTAQLLYLDGVTVPSQSPIGTFELPIAKITGSVLSDVRRPHTTNVFDTIAERDAAWPTPPFGAICFTRDSGISWIRTAKPAWVPQSYSRSGTAIALGGFNNGTTFPSPPEDLIGRLLNDPLIYDATGAKYDGLYTFSFVAVSNQSASGPWTTFMQVAGNANRAQVASCNMNFAIAGAVFQQRLNAGEKVTWQMLNSTGVSFTNVTVNLSMAYTP